MKLQTVALFILIFDFVNVGFAQQTKAKPAKAEVVETKSNAQQQSNTNAKAVANYNYSDYPQDYSNKRTYNPYASHSGTLEHLYGNHQWYNQQQQNGRKR